MKHMAMIALLALSMFVQADGSGTLTDITSLEWKYRVIVVNETQNEEETRVLLKKHTAAINDRDIVWFIINEDRALTNYPGRLSENLLSSTRERYGTGQGRVILIGKDGDIKSRSDHLDLEAIFSEIDAMPMRQYEMRN